MGFFDRLFNMLKENSGSKEVFNKYLQRVVSKERKLTKKEIRETKNIIRKLNRIDKLFTRLSEAFPEKLSKEEWSLLPEEQRKEQKELAKERLSRKKAIAIFEDIDKELERVIDTKNELEEDVNKVLNLANDIINRLNYERRMLASYATREVRKIPVEAA